VSVHGSLSDPRTPSFGITASLALSTGILVIALRVRTNRRSPYINLGQEYLTNAVAHVRVAYTDRVRTNPWEFDKKKTFGDEGEGDSLTIGVVRWNDGWGRLAEDFVPHRSDQPANLS
jgi:hypothetical protein